MSMKNTFEDFEENDSIKTKIKNLFFEKTFLWSVGLMFLILLSTIIVSTFSPHFPFFEDLNIDDDSARYMLSALIQSEAAILAIVVSLSLVAIQHAAAAYSARVIDVFKNPKKNPYLWILVGIYLTSIIYGLAVLMLLKDKEQTNNFINYSQVAYFLGILSFLALIPYILKTLDLLKSSSLINLLGEEITKNNILKAIDEKSDDKNPILPIKNIVYSSWMKYDYETVQYGLNEIGKRTRQILLKNRSKYLFSWNKIPGKDNTKLIEFLKEEYDIEWLENAKIKKSKDCTTININIENSMNSISLRLEDEIKRVTIEINDFWKGQIIVDKKLKIYYNLKEEECRKITKHVFQHLNNIIDLTLNKKDVNVCYYALQNISNIGLTSVEKGFGYVAFDTIIQLDLIGIETINKNLEIETSFALYGMTDVGVEAARYYMPEISLQVIKYLGDFSEEIVKKEFLNSISEVASSLREIGTAGAHLEGVAEGAINSLKVVLEACPKENKFEGVICEAIESVGCIVKKVAKNNTDYNYRLNGAVDFLGKFGIEVTKQNLDKAAYKSSESLQLIAVVSEDPQLRWKIIKFQNEIGKLSADKGLNSSAFESAQSIEYLVESMDDNQILEAIEFLSEIGLSACKHLPDLENSVMQVVRAIYDIGETAVEPNKENEDIVFKAVTSLEMIRIAIEPHPISLARHTSERITKLKQLLKKINQQK